jgi:hypothetical protein
MLREQGRRESRSEKDYLHSFCFAAAVTISAMELAEKIKEGQFKTGKLGKSQINYVGTQECCTAS